MNDVTPLHFNQNFVIWANRAIRSIAINPDKIRSRPLSAERKFVNQNNILPLSCQHVNFRTRLAFSLGWNLCGDHIFDIWSGRIFLRAKTISQPWGGKEKSLLLLLSYFKSTSVTPSRTDSITDIFHVFTVRKDDCITTDLKFS